MSYLNISSYLSPILTYLLLAGLVWCQVDVNDGVWDTQREQKPGNTQYLSCREDLRELGGIRHGGNVKYVRHFLEHQSWRRGLTAFLLRP